MTSIRAFRSALALAGLAIAIVIGVRLTDSWAGNTLADDMARLRSAEHFLRGLIGFAGYPAPADLAFERVLAASDAEARFMEIALSPAATPAAKAYAICRLRSLNSARLKGTMTRIQGASGDVSTMHGDVMTMRPLLRTLDDIVRVGCRT